jgi:hypothetical protein
VRYLYIRSSFCYSEQVAYTTRTITVPSTLSSVADINFNVSLTHSYLSDVEMEVMHKEQQLNYLIGVVVIQIVPYCLAMMTQELISHAATSLQTVVPFQALAAFNGENPQGLDF